MKESARNKTLEQQIDSYVKGNMSESQADKLWTELLEQPEYIEYLKTEIALANIYQSGQSIPNGVANEPTHKYTKSNKRVWWYSAAAVILVAALTSIFIINRSGNIHQWSSQKIDLGRNLASAPVTRSIQSISSPDSLLNAGFKAAIDGDISEAIGIYHLTLERYDKPNIVAKANLNLGILQYNMSKYKASIQYFNKAITHGNRLNLLRERAYWYMGNAYINTKQLKNAKEAITHALSIGKVYKNEEIKLLKRLDHLLKDKNQ